MAGRILTSDEDGMVIACPECEDAGEVRKRKAKNTHADDPEKPYYCDTCKTALDDYVERERKHHGGGVAKYEDVTIDDVDLLTPVERPGEPLTDGGHDV